jgi:Fe2+ transport system protein FeoA
LKNLAELKSGDKAVVLGLSGGCNMQRKLAEMGLTPGCRFEIISSSSTGRVLITTPRGRLAIGHGMAEKIVTSHK